MACNGGNRRDSSGIPDNCGFPTPKANVDAGLIPKPFLLEGAQLVRTRQTKKRTLAMMNLPYSLSDAFLMFRDAVKQTDFKLIQQDNEGFEAEIFMRSPEALGVIQQRVSKCQKASVAFVNIVSVDALPPSFSNFTRSPSPSPTR